MPATTMPLRTRTDSVRAGPIKMQLSTVGGMLIAAVIMINASVLTALPIPTHDSVQPAAHSNDTAVRVDRGTPGYQCCEQGDRGMGGPCKHNDVHGPSSWRDYPLSPVGANVKKQSCCVTGYGVPSHNPHETAVYAYKCARVPSDSVVPLGAFGCTSDWRCGGNSICARQFSTDSRCECAALEDPAPQRQCAWTDGSVPAGNTVLRRASCASKEASKQPQSAYHRCTANVCNCASPDDANYELPYTIDAPLSQCKCWLRNVRNGLRVKHSELCHSGFSMPVGTDGWEVCTCPSRDDPLTADGNCTWALAAVPTGKQVHTKWGASACASGWANSDINGTLTCGCPSIDDAQTSPTPARCHWLGNGSIPNHNMVPSGHSHLCRSGFSFRSRGAAYDVCSCPSVEDEAFNSGHPDACTWEAGMVPPRYHVVSTAVCFFQPTTGGVGANYVSSQDDARILSKEGTLPCPDATYDSPEGLMAKLNSINSSYEVGYWAFEQGTPLHAFFVAVSRQLTSQQQNSIRDRYASDGIAGASTQWGAQLNDDLFMKRVRADVPKDQCDDQCATYVTGVLQDEFSSLATLSGLFKMAKVALDTQDRMHQANVDLAKQIVEAEDSSNVKPKGGFGNFLLGLFSTVLSSAAKTFFKTNLVAKFCLHVGAGILTELKSTTTPEEYDSNASAEVAAAQLKSELADRYLRLLAAYTVTFGRLTASPTKMRMLSVIHNSFDATTEADIANEVLAQKDTILQSLVRILFPAKWQLCRTQTSLTEWRHSESPVGPIDFEVHNDICSRSKGDGYEDLISGSRQIDTTDMFSPDPTYGPRTFAWFCPNGRYDSGKTVPDSTFQSAGASGFPSVYEFQKELARAILRSPSPVSDWGWGPFTVQTPCPTD